MIGEGRANAFPETFFGFVRDKSDASILVEAVISGRLQAVSHFPTEPGGLPFRSGSLIVFCESKRVRWRDGGLWTTSKASGDFLLYREVCPDDGALPSELEVEDSLVFTTPNVRPQTRLVPNGMAKRTITLMGSDGLRYRVIGYFRPRDVEHYYRQTTQVPLVHLPLPSDIPHLSQLQRFNDLPQQQQQQYHHQALPIRPSPSSSSHSTPIRGSPQTFNAPLRSMPSSSNYYPPRPGCPCGGLSGLSHWDYHRIDPIWMTYPVILAPINRNFSATQQSREPHQQYSFHQ
ncbi:hypothetical protein BDR26DRAFT_926138 [Obelidium mucronatum]|nr:hypothetical protein BDR26DRAFT_926138 [Obelidium mucronatum]